MSDENGLNETVANRLASKIALTIDRRRFLRKSAQGAFFFFSAGALGAGLDWAGTQKAFAHTAHCAGSGNMGLGCPGGSAGYPCGPSRCCGYIRSGYPTSCNCSNGSGGCITNSHCLGEQYNIYSSGCWTCSYFNSTNNKLYTTTCCDCGTTGCGDSSGRCVSVSQTISAVASDGTETVLSTTYS